MYNFPILKQHPPVFRIQAKQDAPDPYSTLKTNFTANLARKFREEYFQVNGFLLFILLCIITLFILVVKKNLLLDELAAFEILNESGEGGVLDLVFGAQYISIPLYYGFKFTVITVFIWISCFFFGYKLYYTKLWKLVMYAELLFIIPEILRVIWFLGDKGADYWEIKAFYPLSVLSLLDFQSVPDRWHYPLKALNVFEVLYWFLLAFGIHALANKSKKTANLIILTGYIIPFFFWLFLFVVGYR